MTTDSPRAAIVLAAGKGKRMKSELAKVLHPIAGKPLIERVVETLLTVGVEKIIVVIGHQGEAVREFLESRYSDINLGFSWQKKQLGTGHAVMMAREALSGFTGSILVTAGDVPYVSAATIRGLFEEHEKNSAAATCLSAEFADPGGYGRIVRDGDSDRLLEIVEHKDASEEIRAIHEINSGIFVFESEDLFSSLDEVGSDNSQGEYYLTDVIGILQAQGRGCFVAKAGNPDEVRGINSADQLAELAAMFPQ